MKSNVRTAFMLAAVLAMAGCAYHWGMNESLAALVLAPPVNATTEPRLGALLADAFSSEGRVRPGEGGRVLEVAALSLREEPSALDREGLPRRERLILVVEWRVRDQEGMGGKETVTREYPWTADTASLDWARVSALRLLARAAARAVLASAGEAR
jgi:outer membrane lipopolysaccharide assembly protein LptE/RlpB